MSADAIVGFANASTLLRNARLEGGEPPASRKRLGSAEQHDRPKCDKSLQKFKKRKEEEGKASPDFKKPLSNVMNKDPVQEPELVKTVISPAPQTKNSDMLPPKKIRKKKKKKKSEDEEKGQGKISKRRVTKPSAIKDTTKTKKLMPPKRTKGDQTPERLLTDAVAKKRATLAFEESAELGLEEATRRRADWTPVRDTTALVSDVSPEVADQFSRETPKTAVKPKARFGSLFGDYGFSDQGGKDSLDVNAVRITPDGVVEKKRKIELVNKASSAASAAEKPKRIKSPKRKLQTITAKATEGFVNPDEGNAVHTLTEYFMPPPKTAVVKQIKRRPPAKTKIFTAKTKKAAETATVVLSPETAMKATRNQDFMFGTSSQLVRDESPTFMHEYQQPIKQSELRSAVLAQSVRSSSISLQRPNSLALSPSRNLWSAAACHVEAEFVNLADTPQAEKPVESSIPGKDILDLSAPLAKTQDVWHDVEEMSSPVKRPETEPQSNLEQHDTKTEQSLPLSLAEKALKGRPKSISSKKKASAATAPPDQMPNYQGFSDAHLRKVIKSYGFKAINKREAMISLLEKCWENKQGQVLQEVPLNALLAQPNEGGPSGETTKTTDPGETKSSSPAKKRGRPPKAALVEQAQDEPTETKVKKPRGRPKKDSSATTPPPAKRKRKVSVKEKVETTTADVGDEIYDSSPPTPSPPRTRTPSKPAKTLNLSPSASHHTATETITDSPATSKDPPESHSHLLAAITRAITSQTSTHDPQNLSWHERMLMYEPIVIEDLARWLNHEGLAKVDEDDEVWATLVKEWCESRSICCLWRENLRGLPRARW